MDEQKYSFLPENIKKAISLANEKHEINNIDEAIKLYKHVIELASHLNNAIGIGVCYFIRGDFYLKVQSVSNAINDFNKAIENDPTNAEYYFYLGFTYKQSNNDIGTIVTSFNTNGGSENFVESNLNKALNNISKAIELNPNNYLYFQQRADVYMQLKNDTKAIEDCSRAINLIPDMDITKKTEAILLRGFIYRAFNRFDESLNDFSKGIELNPNSLVAYIHKGDIYLILGDIKNAAANYKRTIEIDPNYVYGYFSLGKMFYLVNNMEMANECFRRAIELDPDYEQNINAFIYSINPDNNE